MTLVAILTPVKEGREQRLRDYLRGLDDPFAGHGLATHFARFVVLDTGVPQLLFSSKFDGRADHYLRRLARFEEAITIWAHCERPHHSGAEALARYLIGGHDRVEPSYVIDVVPASATVAGINEALRLRAELAALALRASGLDAIALAHEFRQLEAIRRLSRT
jgi:hypothetical protein